MKRRSLMLAASALAVPARAQTGLGQEWHGSYAGAVRFYRSIPLEDIYPPPERPQADFDDSTPIAVHFSVLSDGGGTVVWLRIDGGPMQTSDKGEELQFGALDQGVALLASAEGHPRPRSAWLTVRPELLGTEALFTHADGSFWRRHFTAHFTPTGADLIVWVFDAAGTRARTWRGAAVRR